MALDAVTVVSGAENEGSAFKSIKSSFCNKKPLTLVFKNIHLKLISCQYDPLPVSALSTNKRQIISVVADYDGRSPSGEILRS